MIKGRHLPGIMISLLITVALIPSAAQETGWSAEEWDEAYQNHFTFLTDRGNISGEAVSMFSRLDTDSIRSMDPREAAEKMFRLAREADSSLRRGSSRVGVMTELNSRLKQWQNGSPGNPEALERAGKELQRRNRESLLDQTRRGLPENRGQRRSPPSEGIPERAGATSAGRPDIPDHP